MQEKMMDKNQEFIFEMVKYGLANKRPTEPMSNKDAQRLKSDANIYTTIPSEEWSEWSRNMHWALQVAFLQDTERLKNKNKINEWRNACLDLIQDVIEKKRKHSVLDNLVLHFVEKDLLHHIIDVFGWRNLSERERLYIKAFSKGKEK